jgi:hypothetical protein
MTLKSDDPEHLELSRILKNALLKGHPIECKESIQDLIKKSDSKLSRNSDIGSKN